MRYFLADNTDLSVEYRDSGPWRSYQVSECDGETIAEALTKLTVAEVDQDGGDLACYSYLEAPSDVQNEILMLLLKQDPKRVILDKLLENKTEPGDLVGLLTGPSKARVSRVIDLISTMLFGDEASQTISLEAATVDAFNEVQVLVKFLNGKSYRIRIEEQE